MKDRGKMLHCVFKKYNDVVMTAINNNSDSTMLTKISLSILSEIKKVLRDDVIHVMFSGGKDSLVLLDLTLKVIPKEQVKVIFIEVLGNTHEKNMSYVHEIVKGYFEIPKENFVYLKHSEDFYKSVIKWGWPGPRRKWCMNVYKRIVLNRYFKDNHSEKPIVFVGTKVKDSRRRLKRFIADGILLDKLWWNYAIRPLAHFSTTHVYEYIKLNRLPICPLYSELGESGNCVYCPFNMRRSYYLKLYKSYPQWMYKIIKAELEVRKGTPFIISPKRISFRDILGNEVYEKIIEGLQATT